MTQRGNETMERKRLVLVRHGETEGESSIRYHGRTDVPLSAHGRAQMHCVRRALAAYRFAQVYASELSRAVEAAQIVADTAEIVRVSGFNEVDFGNWEGLTAEDIQAGDPELYARWTTSRTDFSYPGGESTGAFRHRVSAALHRILRHAPDADLLFVVHKGVIRSIVAELLRLDEAQRNQLSVALGSIHVVSHRDTGWQADGLDCVDHL